MDIDPQTVVIIGKAAAGFLGIWLVHWIAGRLSATRY